MSTAAGPGHTPESSAPLVLVAGGSSAAGVAVARGLVDAGFRVLTVGSDAGRIGAAAALTGGAVPLTANLADPGDVAALAERVHADFGPVDGLIHLVGGWRGGKDLAAQSDEDWDFLLSNIVSTLRNVTRAFYDDVAASANGRIAIVSSTSVTSPTPGNANYAAAKAAAEAWVQALAAGLAGAQGHPGRGAAVVLVVKALVDEAMRRKSPERKFPGFTDVAELARAVTGLFAAPAGEVNGARTLLVP